jgi:small GTP-binding protein
MTDCGYDYIFKVIVVGDSDVGKTSILLRFTDNMYNEKYSSTVGVDIKVRDITIKKTTPGSMNETVKLHLWDTAGQERFRTISNAYYRNVNAVLLMFDLTNAKSLVNLKGWFEEIYTFSKSDPIIFLVGNKSDLKRMISREEAEKFSKEKGLIYTEVSAKEDKGDIEELFQTITKTLRTKQSERETIEIEIERETLRSETLRSETLRSKTIRLESETSENNKIGHSCCI